MIGKDRRKIRVRRKLKSNTGRARLSVFVSSKHVYAQIIDDSLGNTLVSAKDKDVESRGKSVEIARRVGDLLAKRAKDKKITEVFFDRGGRIYHGRIKALAESAREGGLNF